MKWSVFDLDFLHQKSTIFGIFEGFVVEAELGQPFNMARALNIFSVIHDWLSFLLLWTPTSHNLGPQVNFCLQSAWVNCVYSHILKQQHLLW